MSWNIWFINWGGKGKLLLKGAVWRLANIWAKTFICYFLRIPWTEEPGRLQSMGSQGVGQDWVTSLFHFSNHHNILLFFDSRVFILPVPKLRLRRGHLFQDREDHLKYVTWIREHYHSCIYHSIVEYYRKHLSQTCHQRK